MWVKKCVEIREMLFKNWKLLFKNTHQTLPWFPKHIISFHNLNLQPPAPPQQFYLCPLHNVFLSPSQLQQQSFLAFRFATGTNLIGVAENGDQKIGEGNGRSCERVETKMVERIWFLFLLRIYEFWDLGW